MGTKLKLDECCLCHGYPDGSLVDEGGEFPVCNGCLEDVPLGAEMEYVRSRLDGQSHNCALMFATGQGPCPRTSKTYMRGHCNGNQFAKGPMGNMLGDGIKKLSRQHGMTNFTGKRYLSSLARFAGDPQAWVSDLSDVRRAVESRPGFLYEVDGHEAFKGREVEPAPDVPIAPDIVEAEVESVLAETGQKVFSPKEIRETREKVVDRITPYWARKKVEA